MTTTDYDHVAAVRAEIAEERKKVEAAFERLECDAPRLAADKGITDPAKVELYVAGVREWLRTSRAELSEAEDRTIEAVRQREAEWEKIVRSAMAEGMADE